MAFALTTACADEGRPDLIVVRLGADVDAETLDPRLTRNTTAYRVADLLFDGLVELDANLDPRPGLAERWENPEPTVWIFHLRPGVRFHDGSLLTAEDVVYTFATILDPALQARFRSLYEPIASIQAVDSLTVRMELSTPYAPLLTCLDVGIVPKRYVEGGGDLTTAPVGSGPMRFTSWARGSEIRLESFDQYWGGAPEVDRFSFVIVPDNTSRAQAFEAGDLDIIQSPLSPQDIRRLMDDGRFSGHVTSGIAITYLNFNTRAGHLTDPRLRRAIAMLVDQRTIVEVIYEGVDEPASSVLLPNSWAYSDHVRQPDFDLHRARALLDSLGWRDSDGDGFLERGGEVLTVRLSTHAEDPNQIQAAEFIQSVLRENGVDASLSVSAWPAFLAGVQEGRHQVSFMGWTNLLDPDRGLYTQFITDGNLNYGRYSHPAVDSLLVRARATLDRTERAGSYRRMAEILSEEVPYYVLSYQSYQVFHRPDRSLEVDPRGFMRSALGLPTPSS